MTQRQIDAAYHRANKPTYAHLTPEQKCIARLEEAYDLDRDEVMSFHRQIINAHSAAMLGAVSM